MVIVILACLIVLSFSVSYFISTVNRRCEIQAIDEREQFAKLNQEMIAARIANTRSETQAARELVEQR